MKINANKKIEELTKKLVSINSVNSSLGKESNIAKYIYDYFLNFSYFKSNPEQVMLVKTKNDTIDRHSVVSYIKGKGNKTIILMGHIDTVDIKDYGLAEEYACDVDNLPNKLMEYFDLSDEVIKDINSNDYLFGRGVLDMKSGVANHMYIMEYFLNHLDELNGNLVFVGECDEEGSSSGIISCLDILLALKEKENFEYLACINTDFHTPDNGEDKRLVHIGTIGKLLPSFVVFGKSGHVGDSFNCFDPNLLLSLINKRISLNADLCDVDETNACVPPICLKHMDNKESYSVQTPNISFGYFNYMIYNSSINDVINKCKKIAIESFEEVILYLNKQYLKYCELNNKEYHKLPWQNNVYTYEEWFNLLAKNNDSFITQMDEYATRLNKENPDMDITMFGYKMIQKSYDYYLSKDPVVVIFFGNMFYSNAVCEDDKLIKAINKSIDEVNNELTDKISTQMFYPYISDMSFLCSSNDKENIDKLLSNSPQHTYKYTYPYDLINKLNVSVVNIGTYGKDGHMYTERVEKKHTFVTLPNLIYETILNLLNDTIEV